MYKGKGNAEMSSEDSEVPRVGRPREFAEASHGFSCRFAQKSPTLQEVDLLTHVPFLPKVFNLAAISSPSEPSPGSFLPSVKYLSKTRSKHL